MDELQELVAALPLATLIVGPGERIRAANRGAEVLFGPELVGRHFVSVLRRPDLVDGIETALKDRSPRTVTFTRAEPSGSARYRAHILPLALREGPGVTVSIEDESGPQRADAMRRDFVANVSHELRTPLTSLLGFIETLRGGARDDPAAAARFLATMQSEAERMSRLVSDLLSLSRVEAEERQRPASDVDLVPVVRKAIAGLAQAAADRNVTVAYDGPEAGLVVRGDADQLVQVFSNLIENAVRYGRSPGRVQVAAGTDERALPSGPAYRIAVTDDGPGIDAVHLPRLTERFYRVDSHRSRELGGTGLGLAIVKHIVARHRGALKIESQPGQGSTFFVLLPAG